MSTTLRLNRPSLFALAFLVAGAVSFAVLVTAIGESPGKVAVTGLLNVCYLAAYLAPAAGLCLAFMGIFSSNGRSAGVVVLIANGALLATMCMLLGPPRL
ncbi:MAG TPA: hypothetical protein VEA69_14355 [Tepidisphaeraceae bacterium]|nr:hypothetical protein [Tepidisphaeraceae bacterium]